MNINIHATVSNNSLSYFDYVRENYLGLSANPSRVRFFTYCLDKRSYKKLSRDERVHQAIEMEFGRGSEGHAKAIDRAISNFVAGEINIISDTDIAILMQDWDVFLQDLLVGDESVGVVATRLEGIGGFSTGETKYQQYKNKPSTTWMAMSPHFDFSGLSVMPDKKNFIPVATEELSELYQLPIGYFVVKDTGWQVPSYLQSNRIPYIALDIVKPTSTEAKALRGTSSYHDEFHYHGTPFIAHQRGSMKHRFRIDPLSIDFYDACDQYLGKPAWRVVPTMHDRIKAAGQDLVGLIKAPLRALKNLFR